jgi:hypothetical protein
VRAGEIDDSSNDVLAPSHDRGSKALIDPEGTDVLGAGRYESSDERTESRAGDITATMEP